MLLNQQLNSPLPEQPRYVHESRAALLSVYLHTDPRGDVSYALNPAMRPLPLQSAVEVLQPNQSAVKDLQASRSATAGHQARQMEQSTKHAVFRLASAVYVEGAKKFKPVLEELVGNQVRFDEISEQVNKFARSPSQLTYDAIRRIAYNQVDERTLLEGVGGQKEKFPQSRLDLSTMTTMVDISSAVDIDLTLGSSFDQLATALNPVNWRQSPFWRQSDRVDDKGQIIPHQTMSPKQSWNGLFYEHVEWNWNTSAVASFRNLLKIDFQVDGLKREINMTFCLHSCIGSQLYAMDSRRGVDVDCGCQKLTFSGSNTAQLRTQKNVRFSDMLNRRTPFEGALGSGGLLLYLAPALVGLWMNDLLSYINTGTRPASKGGRE